MKIVKQLNKISFFISIITLTNTANAMLSCKDVKHGNENYFDNMQKLAADARLPDGYFHRYHESVVSGLCGEGDKEYIETLIETGYVARSEVQAIKEALGLDKQYLKGIKYQSIKEKFSYLGSAGSGNVTYYYIYEPESKCGQLAKRALQGNKQAIETLQSGVNYCKLE